MDTKSNLIQHLLNNKTKNTGREKKSVFLFFFFFKAVFCIIVQKGFTLHVVKFWDQKGLHEQPSETLPHNRIFNFFKIFIS